MTNLDVAMLTLIIALGAIAFGVIGTYLLALIAGQKHTRLALHKLRYLESSTSRFSREDVRDALTGVPMDSYQTVLQPLVHQLLSKASTEPLAGIPHPEPQQDEPPLPLNARDLHTAATLARRAGDTQRSLEYLHQALAGDGSYRDFHNCAIEAELCDDIELALRLYQKALATNEGAKDVRVLRSYADALSKASVVDPTAKALADDQFRSLLMSHSDDGRVQIYYLRHLKRHNPEQFEGELSRLQALNPDSVALKRELALASIEDNEGVLVSSLTDLSQDEDLADEPEVLAEIATRLFDAGAKRAGAQTYIKAIEAGLTDFGNLGVDVASVLSQRPLALKLWHLTLQTSPNEQGLWDNLIRILTETNRIDEPTFIAFTRQSTGGQKLALLNSLIPLPSKAETLTEVSDLLKKVVAESQDSASMNVTVDVQAVESPSSLADAPPKRRRVSKEIRELSDVLSSGSASPQEQAIAILQNLNTFQAQALRDILDGVPQFSTHRAAVPKNFDKAFKGEEDKLNV